MNHYQLASFSFRSFISFPELTEVTEPVGDWELAIDPAVDLAAPTWFNTWTLGGRTWAEFGRDGDTHVVRFSKYATFVVDWRASRIRAAIDAHATENTLRHLFLDQIVPLIIGESGSLVLHASAVKIDGQVVGFVGAAGRGKSTLAAALVKDGAELVADDCLVLRKKNGRILARPTYPSVRLLPDSFDAVAPRVEARNAFRVSQYNEKCRVAVPRAAEGEAPLSHVLFLTTGQLVSQVVRLENVSPAEVVFRIMPNNFFLDTANPTRLAEKFDQVCSVAESVACFDLSYARDFAKLDDVVRSVKALIE